MNEKCSIFKILNEAVEIIRNNEEYDCECGGASYFFYYSESDKTINFAHSTTEWTGEDYSDGGIGTKAHQYTLFTVKASIKDYCNLAILLLNDEDTLKYEFSSYALCIGCKPIH